MTVEQTLGYIPSEPSLQIINEWPMMSSSFPVFPTLITLGYLYFIYIIGPRYMRSRPPYSLKKFILCYNIFQILANAWLVKEHIHAGWLNKYGFRCPIIDDFDIQMVQFLVILMYTAQVLDPYCTVETRQEAIFFVYLFGVNVLIYLYLFYDFYKKSYVKTSKQKT